MKKVISYSLWGNDPKYTIGAIRNAETALQFYPEWECWFYCAKDVSFDIVMKLQSFNNTKVIMCSDVGDWKFATKRFLAILENDVERVIFRDCDSRLSEREATAVNEWIESGKVLHIMKDHPWHAGFPILAGMWGLSNKFEENMETLLKQYNNTEQYHYDQIFLAKHVWQKYQNNVIIHDEIFNNFPFPKQRKGLEYIGEPRNEFDLPSDPSHRTILEEYLRK